MKKTKLMIAVFFVLFTGIIGKLNAQSTEAKARLLYVFSPDSLAGFNAQEVSAEAVARGAYGFELQSYMYFKKRKFIDNKYNLVPSVSRNSVAPISPSKFYNNLGQLINFNRTSALPSSGACSNEDFEDNAGLPTQVGGAVNGWNLFGAFGANFCNPNATGGTNVYTIYGGAVVDPLIPVAHRTVTSYFSATSLTQPAGSSFIKLNDNSTGGKVVRLNKTYVVTANNALFRYAYRAVLDNINHACCDQPGFNIKVTVTPTAGGTPTVLACPNITVAAGNACGPAVPGFSTNPANGYAYNPQWVPSSIDLSAYINNFQVSIDVYAIDCSLTGHFGYVYFDALCAPMTIVGNGNGFPAGTPSINVPSCGAAGGSTISAPPGLGPYTWTATGVALPPGFGTPSNANFSFVTTQSGTVQLTMNPPGSCAPIIKILNLITTPAPQALISVTNVACAPGPTTACVSLTTAGSASVTSNIIWNPLPTSLSNGSLLACGFLPTTGSVTVFDTFSCQIVKSFTITAPPPIPVFTLTNSSPSFSITCLNPSMNLSVVTNYNFGPTTVNWLNSNSTFTANTMGVSLTNTNIANYSVTLTDPATTCKTTQTFAVVMNTVAPTVAVSPLTATISCSAVAPTFTASVISPTVNTDICWSHPAVNNGAPQCAVNSSTLLFGPPAGTASITYLNNLNGCVSTRTVIVSSNTTIPVFTMSGTFSLGCVPNNTAQVCATGTVPGLGTAQYYLNANQTATVPYPAAFFTNPPNSGCFQINTPGQYTMAVRNPIGDCQTYAIFNVLSNTVVPSSTISILTQTLTCNNPTVQALATTTTANTTFIWAYPQSGPNTVSSPSIEVGPANGPPTSTSSLVYGNYTLTAINGNNNCRNITIVPINQDFRRPIISPATTNSAIISCKMPTVQITIVNAVFPGQTQNIPITQSTLVSSTYSTTGTSFIVNDIDTYTISSTALSNGCVSNATFVTTIPDFNKPVIASVPAVTIACASNTANTSGVVTVALTNSLSSWNLQLVNPPGSISNPSLTSPAGYNVPNGQQQYTFTVDASGTFPYIVKDNKNGCFVSGELQTVTGTLIADFAPSTSTGFAPLTVNFTNNTLVQGAVMTATDAIVSTWNYGNGAPVTSTAYGSPSSATYNNPGTYTVTLVSKRGGCIDTVRKVIVVDIPSKLDVPNVFTPNGDKNNDVFFLKTTNLTKVSALIFDRWGNKVYDLESTTGNIAWDGKNQAGMDCANGVYFYIIKAEGKDGIEYEKKGQVSLFR